MTMMTLKDLIDVIDPNRESDTEVIQLCSADGEWDDYDTFRTRSPLLKPFYEYKVECIGAIDANVIRVDLSWENE